MQDAKVTDDMVAKKFAIKAALENAIRMKMVQKTKNITGNQTLHKTQIDDKLSLKEQLLAAEKEKKENAKLVAKKEVLPNSLQ